MTLAGDDNLEGTTTDEDGEEIGDGHGTDHNLYLEILGWKLNATARKSNVVKNIENNSWTDEGLGFTWNDPTNYRSYWGKSFNYGTSDADEDNYPTSANGATEDGGLSPYVKYVNLTSSDESPLLKMGASDYCAENTNDAESLSGMYSPAITSVLLRARVCDEDGNGLSLVRFNGELFQEEDYLDYVLNHLVEAGQLDYFIGTTEDNVTTYRRLDAECVKLAAVEDDGNGRVNVVLSEEWPGEGTTLYKLVEGEFTEADADDAVSAIQGELESFNETANAISYNGGEMYYIIPIEHLNNNTNDDGTLAEANYGVVRNHHYYLTITSIEHVGHGVYDPDEVIVPNPDEYDSEFYYLTSNVNILSWKIVSQSVSL